MARMVLRRIGLTIGTVAVLPLGLSAQQMTAEQISSAGSVDGLAESARLRARGLELGFNLDHAEALSAFRAAIAANPGDAAAYRLAAATLWVSSLFQQGAVTVEDYLGQARSEVARKPPPAEVDAAFREYVARALALSEKRLRDNPRDADAHFQVGAAHGFLASYTGTIEGRVLSGVGAARRAYSGHNRVLELDPRRKDAGLIVGMYRYAISTLPAPWRLLAGIAGFGGGRQRGLRLVEEAAAYPSDVQSNALFTLILIYNREERYDDALRIIGQLQRMYPRNRLLWLEAGSTALRAGRAAAASDALEQGLAKLSRDPRPRAFGEEARWRCTYGAALVALKQIDAAERELRAALNGEAHEWVRGRAHKELGKLADLAGDRSRAVEEYRVAVRLCRADHDSVCSDEASKLLKGVRHVR